MVKKAESQAKKLSIPLGRIPVKGKSFSKEHEKLEDTNKNLDVEKKKSTPMKTQFEFPIRRFTFGLKTREKILMQYQESKKKDPHRRYSFTKTIPPLIRFMADNPAKLNSNSKQYMAGKMLPFF